MELETPPALQGKTILNFHFDYWNPPHESMLIQFQTSKTTSFKVLVCVTPQLHRDKSRDEGQLRPAPPTPLCYKYSEPPGHEDSPGSTLFLPYPFKLSKSRLSDRLLGLFLVISEVGSPDHIAKSMIFKI